ncbi:hypothetical protein [Pseudactinotalea sp.]|uniref:hypothetical protein n=1 Tax=Pseudactinotalea sp. TaxID=1926260 RepID=UPI003B3BBE09
MAESEVDRLNRKHSEHLTAYNNAEAQVRHNEEHGITDDSAIHRLRYLESRLNRFELHREATMRELGEWP